MKFKREKESRLVLILAGSFVLALLCETAAAQLPPLPTGDRNFPKALIPVVEAEYAFAEYSIAHGMKDAFLRFAAPDGVIIRRAPVNAIELWTKTTPAPTGRLSWYPIFADVSHAGDLGYTTGPWEFRDKPDDKDASGNGHFITLWRKQSDGAWKYEFDMGVSHAAPASRETALTYPASARVAAEKNKAADDVDASRASLLDAERALSKDASAKGSAKAFLAHADEAVRLYRQNSFPLVGIESARKALDGKTDVLTWHATKAFVARSGDLGYVYGTYESNAKAADADLAEQGNYMRIWKRHGGKWRVVLEVATPIPPPPKQ
ncbi:MAG TPA: nuclear transport factor 2 family protein [Pyrinomonadaceae bacterium]|nr:nuclear transport factor 2 family protein [Pyrinomonadaceae bacterium]